MKRLTKYSILLLVISLIAVSACNTKKTSVGSASLCQDSLTGKFVDCAKLTQDNQELPPPQVVPSGKIGIKIGDSAPDFALYDTDGKQVKLSDYKGKQGVVVDFFATWCPFCNNEMPRLDKIVKSYNGKVQIIAVDDDRESVADIKAFRDKYDFSFPVLVDLEASVAELYQIAGHPYTFYINKDGVIVDKKYGSSVDEDIIPRVQKTVL